MSRDANGSESRVRKKIKKAKKSRKGMQEGREKVHCIFGSCLPGCGKADRKGMAGVSLAC